MLEAASCSRRQGRGKETGSVAYSQAVRRGSAGSKGGAGGRAGIEPGWSWVSFASLPAAGVVPSLPPAVWEQMCCLCQRWQPPPHTPAGLLRSQSLVPSSSSSSSSFPRLGPVSLGMAVESSAHSACLPCNPPSFLSPAGLFVGKFKADECRGALGLRARR